MRRNITFIDTSKISVLIGSSNSKSHLNKKLRNEKIYEVRTTEVGWQGCHMILRSWDQFLLSPVRFQLTL